MRKIFTLIAAVAMATSMNAQTITFGDVAVLNADLQTEWINGDVKLVIVKDAKPSIDRNSAYFGTAEATPQYTSRLKMGGKSSSTRSLALTVPSDGIVKVAARSSNKDAIDRTVVLNQDGQDLVSQLVYDAQAISVDSKTVYPYVTANVKAGTIAVNFPIDGINFYAFEFTATTTTTGIKNVSTSTNSQEVYNLAGQRVSNTYKGVIIQDGKKSVQK